MSSQRFHRIGVFSPLFCRFPHAYIRLYRRAVIKRDRGLYVNKTIFPRRHTMWIYVVAAFAWECRSLLWRQECFSALHYASHLAGEIVLGLSVLHMVRCSFLWYSLGEIRDELAKRDCWVKVVRQADAEIWQLHYSRLRLAVIKPEQWGIWWIAGLSSYTIFSNSPFGDKVSGSLDCV